MRDISVLINGDRGKNYPSQKDIMEVGEIPFINAGHLVNNSLDLENLNYITRENYNRLSSGKVIEGDIVYCLRGSLGKKALIKDISEGAIASSLVIIRPINNLVFSEYLLLSLESSYIKKQLVNANNGSSQPNLSAKSVSNFLVKLHDKQNQINIIQKMSKISSLIESKKKQLFEYDQLIKSRFVEMFGDIFNGKSNYPKIKISEAVVPKIERANKSFSSEDKIKYVDISSVDNQRNIIIGYTEYLMKDAPSRAQQHVRKDDIIISTVRPNLNNVAKVPHDYSNIVASSGFCVLRASKVKSNYLFAVVSMQSFADYLASLTTGANYPAVSDRDILNFEIPNAPIEEQIKFSDFIKQIDKLKFAVQKSIDETQKLFDSLMQEYFG